MWLKTTYDVEKWSVSGFTRQLLSELVVAAMCPDIAPVSTVWSHSPEDAVSQLMSGFSGRMFE